MTTRPRFLLVSKYFPYHAHDVHGVFKRLDMWVEALGTMGEIALLFYLSPDGPTRPEDEDRTAARLEERWGLSLRLHLCVHDSSRPVSRWEAYGPSLTSMHRQGVYRAMSGPVQVEALEEALEWSPDAVFAHRLSAMCPVLRTDAHLPPVLFDLDDIEHLAKFRSLSTPPLWAGKRMEYLQLPSLWLGERRAIRCSRRTFVCSDHDRRYLEAQGHRNVGVVPNAVSIPDESPIPAEPRLLFLGNYAHLPNRNAARRLLTEIWPRIRAEEPHARLVVAGPGDHLLDDSVREAPGAEVPGFVEDLKGLYRASRVVCCPILAGGGTRFKIVEAAAHGRPVVSTEIGAEGLELVDGESILIRDDAAAFARACLELLRDDARAARLGEAARRTAIRRYDRRRVVEEMRRQVRLALDETPASREPGVVS